jgi:hypothetical protein
VIFSSPQQAGSLINIQTDLGENVLTFTPVKQYQSLVFSSSKLKQGETYNVYLGGSSTGAKENGLYENGAYTPGAFYTRFTISSIVTNLGRIGSIDRGMNNNMNEKNEWEIKVLLIRSACFSFSTPFFCLVFALLCLDRTG